MSSADSTPRRGAVVRLARTADLPQAAASFARTFDASVWARMGVHSSQAYLRAWMQDPREFMVVAEDPRAGIVGGLLGTMRKDQHRSPVLRAGASTFAPAFARDIANRPATALELGRRVVSGLGAAIGHKVSPPSPPSIETFEPQWPQDVDDPGYVAAYWVAQEARGQRLATRMCARAREVFAQQGLQWCDVATYADNIASQTTALRAGFRLVRQEGEHLQYRMFIGEGEPGMLRVSVEPSPLDDAALPQRWRALLDQTPDASGFHAWGWRRALLAESPGAFVATAYLGDRPIAVFPLERDGDTVRLWGTRRSNYSGPLYDPEHMPSVLGALRIIVARTGARAVDLSGLREHSPFRRAARGLVLGGMGAPAQARTIACTEIDLREGWDAVWRRRKKKHRGNWRRALRKLESLGRVQFEELTTQTSILAAMDEAVGLYETRWAEFNVDRAFGRERELFVRAAASALAGQGQAIMSVLRLEGEVIAFSYALRHGGVSNSYTLAHDDRYAPYSPGQLLMIYVLEEACKRGDPSYDFSVGDEVYKEVWGTSRLSVYRLAWGQGALVRTSADLALAAAREQPTLRRLKQEGVRALLPEPSPALVEWSVHQVSAADTGLRVESLDLAGMRALVPEPAFAACIDRVFRGDTTCVVLREATPVALVWRAAKSRREGISRGPTDAQVYYDLRMLESADRASVAGALGSCLLVSTAIVGLPVLRTFLAEAELTAKR
ncbi:MAG: GNAT family N-acetyltransferase [Nannocystaceae bacterium]|nr:GNAT family N-acetyltransferase [bacterium]